MKRKKEIVSTTIEFVETLNGSTVDIRPTTAAELAKHDIEVAIANKLATTYRTDGMSQSLHKDGLLWKIDEAMFRPALYNLAMAYMNSNEVGMACLLLSDLADNGYAPALELIGEL